MEDFNAGWSLKFKELMRRHFKNDKFQQWNERQMAIHAEIDTEHPNKSELERKQMSDFKFNEELEEAYFKFVEEVE